MVTAGTAAVTGLSGCSGDSGGPETPEEAVQDFFDTATSNQDDPEAFADEAKSLVHSESPLVENLGEFVQSAGSGDPETDVPENVETEVVTEDLSADEITSEFGRLVMSAVSDDVMGSIVEENAIVETTLEFEDGSTRTNRWLVTKEDGNWVLFVSA